MPSYVGRHLGGGVRRHAVRGRHRVGDEVDLERLPNHGYLPRAYLSERPHRVLNAWVSDHLEEEIAAGAVVRNVPAFADFLAIAALSDTEPVNVSNIARESGVSSHTVPSYFEILVDTLLGRWLPACRWRPKRRVAVAPTTYFADVGVVNHLARRGPVSQRSERFGKAFENWVHHELTAANAYAEACASLDCWRLSTGTEVDVILDDMETAIDAKATARVSDHHLKGLRELHADHPEVGRPVVVCLEPKARRTADGIGILPATESVKRLGDGEWITPRDHAR